MVIFAATLMLGSGAWAGTERVLYSFTGGHDGSYPFDIGRFARDSSGSLFGTTGYGGNLKDCSGRGCGTVFELKSSKGGYEEKTIHTFTGGKDGAYPGAGVILDSSGNIYGTTGGGSNNCGTVFELSGSRLTTLHSFSCGADGAGPGGLIRDKSGNLYGTTYAGGNLSCNPPGGCGVAYEISSSGAFSVLYTFCANGGCTDGANPASSLVIDGSGALFGMTEFGGFKDFGAVFELSKASHGWKESVLHSFRGSDGSYPIYSGLTLGTQKIGKRKVSTIFGVTAVGGSKTCSGAGCGTAFEMHKAKTGYELTTLHNFIGQNGDGATPWGTLIEVNGRLFGTTYGGGDLSQPCQPPETGCGTVFELTQKNRVWSETIVYTFSGNDGDNPISGLAVDSSGHLFGVTARGGSSGTGCGGYGCGTVFEVTP